MKVGIYGGAYGYWKPLHPRAMYEPGTMLGGGETCLIHSATQLASHGHDVTLFAKVAQEGYADGVLWQNRERTKRALKEPWDVWISWEDAEVAAAAKKAHQRVMSMVCNHYKVRQLAKQIDTFVTVSDYHQWIVRFMDNAIPFEKCVLIPVPIDMERYKGSVHKEPYRIIHCSSPDRGLAHLVRIFPKVRAKIPEAELHVFYEIVNTWKNTRWLMNKQGEDIWKVYRAVVDPGAPGIIYHGPVDQMTLAQEQMKSQLLVYPCDTVQPTEGFSGSIGEALAARCAALISDCDALPEVWGSVATLLPLPINDDEWVAAIYDLLTDEPLRRDFAKRGMAYVEQHFALPIVGRKWNELVTTGTVQDKNAWIRNDTQLEVGAAAS